MTLDGPDVLYYTLAFLVPGFIMHSTLSAFVPQKAERSELSFLRFLALSCINYGVWAWLVYLIYRSSIFIGHPFRTAAVWGLIIFVSPLLLGLLIGYFNQREIVRKMLQQIGINTIHGCPTAWDYKFSKTDKPEWVLVTLKDGSTVAGLFGSKSFASSEPGDRDLFIQKVWKLPDNGGESWQPASRSAGIWIASDQIKHIEFMPD